MLFDLLIMIPLRVKHFYLIIYSLEEKERPTKFYSTHSQAHL